MRYLAFALLVLSACSGAGVQTEQREAAHRSIMAVADSGIRAYVRTQLKDPATYQPGRTQYARLKKNIRLLLVNDPKERGTSVTTYNRLRRRESYEYLHNSDVIELPMAVYQELQDRGHFQKTEYRKVYLYGRHFKGKKLTSLRSLSEDINMMADLNPLSTDLIAFHAYVARDSAGEVMQGYTAFSLTAEGNVVEAVPLKLTSQTPMIAEYLADRAKALP